jgi:hypothetical protein
MDLNLLSMRPIETTREKMSGMAYPHELNVWHEDVNMRERISMESHQDQLPFRGRKVTDHAGDVRMIENATT